MNNRWKQIYLPSKTEACSQQCDVDSLCGQENNPLDLMDRAHANAHASLSGRASIAALDLRLCCAYGQARYRGCTTFASKSHADTDISHVAPRVGNAVTSLTSVTAGVARVPQIARNTASISESEVLRGDRAWQEGWSLLASFQAAGNEGDFHSWRVSTHAAHIQRMILILICQFTFPGWILSISTAQA